VLTMTESHKQSLLLNYPHMMDKVFTLKQFAWMTEEHIALFNELDRIIAELQTQFQLGQPLDETLRQQAISLESQLPDFDIVDPFGGSQNDYDVAANEIEKAVKSAFQKFKQILANQD
jgi:protein-tyrosine-phosphatase